MILYTYLPFTEQCVFLHHSVFFMTTLGSIAFMLCFVFFSPLTNSVMSILRDKFEGIFWDKGMGI